MSADLQERSNSDALARGLMLPYVVVRDFLDEATVVGLLNYVTSHEAEFTPTTIRGGLDPSYRLSMRLRDLGIFKQVFKTKIMDLVPRVIAEMRATPVEDPKLETELVAHGDGAFYRRHIDTKTGYHDDSKRIRVLSGIYYFNAEPKAFTGGNLRIYAIGGKEGENFIDIEPTRNSLLIFLSWALHEVLPVSCPSKRFIDSRFAINCWVCGNHPRNQERI